MQIDDRRLGGHSSTNTNWHGQRAAIGECAPRARPTSARSEKPLPIPRSFVLVGLLPGSTISLAASIPRFKRTHQTGKTTDCCSGAAYERVLTPGAAKCGSFHGECHCQVTTKSCELFETAERNRLSKTREHAHFVAVVIGQVVRRTSVPLTAERGASAAATRYARDP